jgi:hypothetical protein
VDDVIYEQPLMLMFAHHVTFPYFLTKLINLRKLFWIKALNAKLSLQRKSVAAMSETQGSLPPFPLKDNNKIQAGAELCQAQTQLG